MVPLESPPYEVQFGCWNRNAISFRLRANRNTHFAWGTVPQFGQGVELGGRVCYPVKLLHISCNLFVETEMISLTVYEPIAIQILLGWTVPQFGRGVEVGGRVWYPVKLFHISCNLLAGTEMLYLTVYEPIAIQILLGGPSPNMTEGSS